MPELQGNAAPGGSGDVLRNVPTEVSAPPTPRDCVSQTLLCVGLWIVAVFACTPLDFPVSAWLTSRGIDQVVDHAWWAKTVKFGGTFWMTLALAVLVGIFHRLHWRGAIFVALCGVISGVNGI